jgi:hypothetical protein
MLNVLSNISLYTPYRSTEEWRKALLIYKSCTKLCRVYGHFHAAATLFLWEKPTENICLKLSGTESNSERFSKNTNSLSPPEFEARAIPT